MDAILQWDRGLFGMLNGHPWPGWVDAFFVFITDDARARVPLILIWLLLLLACGPVWRRRALWLLPLVALSDGLSSQVLKDLFARPRPCHEPLAHLRLLVNCGPGYSFPSSHAANMGAAGLFLAAGLARWRWRLPVLLAAALVAYSRIHVGVHYPLDIVGGGLAGALVAWGALALMGAVPWRWLGLGGFARARSPRRQAGAPPTLPG